MKLFKAFGFNKPKETTINTIIVDDTSVSTMEMVRTGKQYPVEVQQIHHEFHSAADNLLLEAKSIIEEARTKNVTKINRLELLGFKQAAQVTELKPLQQKAELSKEQLESLAYYQREYPFNKFITEEQVKTICHKYNLVCGEVSRFKGFVPEKNLSDIEKFSLKDNETSLLYIEAFKEGKSIGLFSGKNLEIRNERGYAHIYPKHISSNYSFQQNKLDLIKSGEFYGRDYGNLFGLKDKEFLTIKVLNNQLQICAPIKDMDISGLELTEGYKLTKKHIPDPVVLQLVKNGYLIITAWGDEASDKLVVNQINN